MGNEAWVTSVPNDDSVPWALVLSQSLRKSHTSRKIVAIVSRSLSKNNRSLLWQHFDHVFLLDDEMHRPNVDDSENKRAMLYTFGLSIFDTCVFIPATSMVMENVDNLFQTEYNFLSRINSVSGEIDLSLFVIKPNRGLQEMIDKTVGLESELLTDQHLKDAILQYQQSEGFKVGMFPDTVIAEFSLVDGVLNHDAQPSIVCFKTTNNENINMPDHFGLLKVSHLGLFEKCIMETWKSLWNSVSTKTAIPSGKQLFQNSLKNESIAIVGMSCRYPGANTLQEFWDLLYAGEEAICELPIFRRTKQQKGEGKIPVAGFLSVPVDEFDSSFFGISPKEAAYMDPQMRLLLEVVWESLENAGINPQTLHGTHAGVFTGSWLNDYKELVSKSADNDFLRSYLGNSIGAAASRVSFLLGLTGPSIATESGCSSAIVALNLAVKSLRAGETNLALAGAVNLILDPFVGDTMNFMVAPDGRCKTFDANANGFGRAEGCGVLVLKRLSDALRDRDHIWALVRGSAISQEGLSRSLGTPTVYSEALAMKLALEDANVLPEQVSFVETHGTGTPVGDPLEVAAITKAYHSSNRKEPLIIGSVKTNVGHTESCSGITGIIKAVLAMQHDVIPKHRNLERLNPEIFLDAIPAIIPMENLPWPKIPGRPRLCGVSSFGITGTDGHVILEDAPEFQLPKVGIEIDRPIHVLTISAKTKQVLSELLEKYEKKFTQNHFRDEEFANIAYTANVGRAAFNHRAFIVARSHDEAAKKLLMKNFLQEEITDKQSPSTCFLFPGQGSQYPGMAKSLYETSPIFQFNFDACDKILMRNYNISIRQVLWETDFTSSELLNRTIYSQTSIFCVEYCLLKLWQSWGVHPDYVLGHSLGEFCAAVAAGLLDFTDALKLVAERSLLIDSLPLGRMLVVKASKPLVQKLMMATAVELDVAAENSSEQTVLAGDASTIEIFQNYLKSQNIKAMILNATHAFHSRLMDPILERFELVAKSVTLKCANSRTQFVSGMLGRIIENVIELGSNYWVRHTRDKVSFVEACTALSDTGCSTFLEVGSQPILSSFVMFNNEDINIHCLPSLRKGQDDWNTILTSLGKLYLLGYPVNWKEYDKPYSRKKVTSLPFHPFHRKPFWVECIQDNSGLKVHPLLGAPVKNAAALNIFQNDITLSTESVAYLKDHCIGNRVVFPGAAYAEMILTAGYLVAHGIWEKFELPTRAVRLENLKIETPLELNKGKSCSLQTLVDLPTENKRGFHVKVFHQNNAWGDSSKWIWHTSATFNSTVNTKECLSHWDASRINQIIQETQPYSPNSFYKSADEQGLKFGDTFRMVRQFWAKQVDAGVDEVITEILLPSDWKHYMLHPLIIDAIFQSVILTQYHHETLKLKVPVSLGELTLFPEIGTMSQYEKLYIHAWIKNHEFCAFVSSPDWAPVAFVKDVRMVSTNVATINSVLEQQSSSVPEAWEETYRVVSAPFFGSIERSVALLPSIHTTKPSFEQKIMHSKTQRLIYLYIVDALEKLGWDFQVGTLINVENVSRKLGISQEHQKLVRFYFTILDQEGIVAPCEKDNWKVLQLLSIGTSRVAEIYALADELKNDPEFASTTRIHEHIAKRLPKILRGEDSALQILFPREDNSNQDYQYSADKYYQTLPGRAETLSTFNVISCSLFQESFAVNGQDTGKIFRVLEVGSGTGSITKSLLKSLQKYWASRFEFYFSDISQSFFLKAEKRFAEFRENMKFVAFNIEKSPLSQGIPLGYFDLVAATDVLHATRDLEETLVHLRQTLKPGGKLIFTETVQPVLHISFVFGLLAGYWRFMDRHWRRNHCCVDGKTWTQILAKCGFHKPEVTKTYMGQFAVISAEAEKDCAVEHLIPPSIMRGSQNDTNKWVVLSDKLESNVTEFLSDWLRVSGFQVITLWTERHLDRDTEIKDLLWSKQVRGVIFTNGLNHTETDQRKLSLPLLKVAKALASMSKPPHLFVLTKGVQLASEDALITNPNAATLGGMLKSLKNENSSMIVRCVDVDPEAKPKELVAQVLHELAMMMTKSQKEASRVQVAYRGGLRQEPKLVKAILPTSQTALKLPPGTDSYQLKLPTSKLIKDLEFQPLDQEETFGNTQVEIKIKAFALNFRDLFAILKPSKEFERLNGVGRDFSGEVRKAGKNSKWKVGERVFGACLKECQMPSHLTIHSGLVIRVPNSMTHWEAATLPAVFFTAYHCLVNVAKIRKEESVLIHTASGGVGLAAIQVARLVGAQIIVTAGNSRKRKYLRGLGIEHVFHSRDTSYEHDILRITNGRGVDVVLNSITGAGVKEATLRATAQNGRFVEMSKLSVWTRAEVQALRPDVCYSIVDLMQIDGDTHSQLLNCMQEYLDSGHLKPIPHVRFDALYIRQALQYFQKAKHIGKVVIAMPEVVTEQGQFTPKVNLFNGESTYLITGGLGGIGFEVCKWMLGMGATDIVLMGRSNPKPEVEDEIKNLNEAGFNVNVALGNVADYNRCQQIIQQITGGTKPLRGVMHCAGVLQDNLFSQLTWADYEAAYAPKVNGTRNLHQLTRNCPLEHFVVYSSMVALLGTPGQPNHASANCFEDAFIHYRHSVGLPGTTINWGQWAQVGCAKEASLLGVLPVSVQRMLNGLEMALRAQKRQVCFAEFDSLQNVSILCPLFKNYVDERLWNQHVNNGSAQITKSSTDENKFWEEMNATSTKAEKITVMTRYVSGILKTILRLDPDETLRADARIQEMGVDSLMMIELKNNLQTLVGKRATITSNVVKNSNTIQDLVDAIVENLMVAEKIGMELNVQEVSKEPLSGAELMEMLKQDSILDSSIKVETSQLPASKSSEIETVLVTGATGQVAPYLIARLCKTYRYVKRILCLVRGTENDIHEKLVNTLDGLEVDWQKVKAIPGNVALTNLGMSSDRYAELCKSVDVIFHFAANTNPGDNLQPDRTNNMNDIRNTNICGTVNILRFACAEKVKQVCYPSTLFLGYLGESCLGNQKNDGWPDNGILAAIVSYNVPGLEATKWVCELLLRQANERGIPCKVFRFPFVGGESSTGKVDPNKNLHIGRLINFLRLGAMPNSGMPLNVVPVDVLAEVTLQLFMNDAVPNEVFNLTHPKPGDEKDFVKAAEQEFGKQIEIMQVPAFLEMMQVDRHRTKENSITAPEKLMVMEKMFFDAMEIVKGSDARIHVSSANKILKYIANYGQNFPPCLELVAKNLSYLKQMEF